MRLVTWPYIETIYDVTTVCVTTLTRTSVPYDTPFSPVSALEITMFYIFMYPCFFKLGLIFYLLNNSPTVKAEDRA